MKEKTQVRPSKESLARAFALALLVASAFVTVGMIVNHAQDSLLRGDASHAASRWAEHVSRNVPDIDFIFEGDPPSVPAQEHLSGLRHAGDIVRFDIFSADGRLRLRSESLSGLSAADSGSIDTIAREVATTGIATTGIEQSVKSAITAMHGFAYVPVRLFGKIRGVARVEVDHTTQAARVRSAFATVAAAVGGLMLLLFSVSVWAWQRHRREKVIAEARVRYLAQHDPLTGAANRAAFQDALTNSCRHAEADSTATLAVLCVDLDHFKDVNDCHGHAVGDDMLRQVTARLTSLVRSGDVVARLGGDEFAVLQTGVTHADDVATLASRVAEALAEPYDLTGQRVSGGASVGAAIYGVDGDKAEILMLRADAALYSAKAKGRRTYAFFDPALERQREHRRTLTQELRAALDEDALSMDFQPLFDIDGCTVRGYEALARWSHPSLGVVSPSDFVPLAEETGLIVQLGHWALRHACAAAATWPGSLSVAVNMSPAQFRHGDAMLAQVKEVLRSTKLAPERLEIEITESLLIGDTANALRCLHALHAMGVKIALDDFGTGFSSLAYLWRFPFDKVKIDRSFTQGLGQDEKVTLIVKSIVSLAHALRIRVNAEGIETSEQMAMLTEYGCDELQGFLLGRPGMVDVPAMTRQPALRAALTARTDLAQMEAWPASL